MISLFHNDKWTKWESMGMKNRRLAAPIERNFLHTIHSSFSELDSDPRTRRSIVNLYDYTR